MMENKKKPDCYNCIFRRDVPGDAHSQCAHPKNKESLSDPILSMFSILASVGRVKPINTGGLKVKGDPHGIRNGWFNYPFNFDPVWLEECEGFKQK